MILLKSNLKKSCVQIVEEQWGRDLIQSWNRHDWISLPQKVGADLAKILGAESDEIIVADSTSVNIFKTVSAALDLRPDRHVIISGKPKHLKEPQCTQLGFRPISQANF